MDATNNQSAPGNPWLTGLFAATLFLSAALLFCVQPMIGKLVLPLLGGAPAVWNTCMLFFQAALLLGYMYAHYSVSWFGVKRQSMIHVVVILVILVVLPFAANLRATTAVPSTGNPVPWLLLTLAVNVGLPFVVISATAPMLQRWFMATGAAHARDPYFLYAASNAGSLVGLLGYPSLVEPRLRLIEQSWWWSTGYVCLVILMIGCAVTAHRKQGTSSSNLVETEKPVPSPRLRAGQLSRWVLLAFVPSSLMLGLTTYLTTDVAPFPLLWVVPLTIYLVTFILVFGRRPVMAAWWVGRAMCLVTVVLVVAWMVEATHPAWLMTPLHLLVFGMAALICHGELAKSRPPSDQLTQFYMCMSVGGLLGGVFNVLLAPVLFRTVAEYPLLMIIACLIRPALPPKDPTRPSSSWGHDTVWALGIGVLTVGMILLVRQFKIDVGRVSTLLAFGIPVLIAYRFVEQPRRFGMSLIMILGASSFQMGIHGQALVVERNFFGVLRVTEDAAHRYRQLVHGNTLHGRESLDPSKHGETLPYYRRKGPVGKVFEAALANETRSVGVIGLGAGVLASYATANQDWAFYEIDPAVDQVAREQEYFTFMKRSGAHTMNVVLGDARLRLREAPDGHYGLFVIGCIQFGCDSGAFVDATGGAAIQGQAGGTWAAAISCDQSAS